jgi:hypothetical protein
LESLIGISQAVESISNLGIARQAGADRQELECDDQLDATDHEETPPPKPGPPFPHRTFLNYYGLDTDAGFLILPANPLVALMR